MSCSLAIDIHKFEYVSLHVVHNVIFCRNVSRLCVRSPTLQGSSIHQDDTYNFSILFTLASFFCGSLCLVILTSILHFLILIGNWLSSLGFSLDRWNINTRRLPWSGYLLQAWMCQLSLPLKGLSPLLPLSNSFSFTFTLFGLCPWFVTWLHASTQRTI